jgi:putative addiction module component (TIGR02574 family)
MDTTLQSLTELALALSIDDRAALAETLLDSIEPLDPAWDAEIKRRVADLDAGRTRFVSADEALARLDAHIARRLAARQ